VLDAWWPFVVAEAQIAPRLFLAFGLGAVLGAEREAQQRPAGLRTHILVALGSAAFTLVSVYGFEGLGTVRDPARIAAQVVTGIGFLGAGTIWRTESTVRGLTTAASIWIVAAIGMLAGAGMYVIAVVCTGLAWLALYGIRRIERRTTKRPLIGEPSIVPDTGSEAADSMD
jgi:putative Mg2+ transporter-C (MgtC) family protein